MLAGTRFQKEVCCWVLKVCYHLARQCATTEIWEGAVRRAMKFEEDYWSSDNIHDSVEPVIVTFDCDDENELFLDNDDD